MEGEQIKNIELHWNTCQKLKKSRIDYVKDYGSSKTIYGIHDEFLVLFGQIHCDEYKNYLGIWILAQNIWLDYNKIHWQIHNGRVHDCDQAQIFCAHGLIHAHRKSRVIGVRMAMCTSKPIIGKDAPPPRYF